MTKISKKTKLSCKQKFEEVKKNISGITLDDFLQVEDLDELTAFAEKLSSTKTVVPFGFYCKLKNDNMVQYFMRNAYFKFFNKELAPYLKKLEYFPPREQTAFFLFANALGCFAKDNILDENKEKTESLLCHKASNLLARLLQSETLLLGGFRFLFGELSTENEPNQDFYHFLSAQNGKNSFVNAKILVNNSRKHKDYFARVMTNFDKAKGFKKTLNAHGQPVELPWETALNMFYHSRNYKGVTKDTRKMAKLYGSRGIKQKTFNEACDIFEEAKISCTPHHILGKPLKEKNDGTRLFTYEFLDKHDPRNAILGLYCSCCATLASEYYGRDITVASVLADDVQNVVVRDFNGTIIGKGTLYVNTKKGYAVFNDFEVEYKYRSDCDYVWKNGEFVMLPTPNEIKREAIFNTFLRAVNDFKTEYDLIHPNKPLKKVAVGSGFNKLKDLCEERLKRSKTTLKVPSEYCFNDAENYQFLILGINRKAKNIIQPEDKLLY